MLGKGFTTGQTFIVGKTDIIRDPGTGEVLDESVNEVARLQVDTVKDKLSICEVVNGDIGSVTNGMKSSCPNWYLGFLYYAFYMNTQKSHS